MNLYPCNKYIGIPPSLYLHVLKGWLKRGAHFFLNKLRKQKLPRTDHVYTNNKHDVIHEKKGLYEPITINENQSLHILVGFWQSHKYFDDYRHDIVQQYRPNFELSAETRQLIERIEQDPHSVSVHVRRGDYLLHQCCVREQYYFQAIQLMKSMSPQARFYIFSDDIEYCKTLFAELDVPIVYAEHHEQVKAFEDIWAMSKCRSNIICNSSFSWWGAYLNDNQDKHVIVPTEIKNTNGPNCICDGWIELGANQ